MRNNQFLIYVSGRHRILRRSRDVYKRQIYGYLAEEILGKSISILEPALLVEETKELVELIKQKDKIHHFETLRLRKDGKIKNVSLTLSPIFDNSENIITILVIARDITLRKKAVEELKNCLLYTSRCV